MNTAPRTIIIGAILGLIGAVGQAYFIWLNSPQFATVRVLLTVGLAAFIGVLAGFTAKQEALKAAALAGFVAGAIMSLVGLGLLVRNPSLIGNHPFSSAESFLRFMSAVMGGTVVSSWLISGFAVVIALPIAHTLSHERITD